MEVTAQIHGPTALTPGQISSGTRGMEVYVGRTACIDAVYKRKVSCPCRELNPDLSSVVKVVDCRFTD
jgi:hypothetical protein